MPARPEGDGHTTLLQEVPGAHHVIDARDLEVDVLHADLVRGEQGDLVVHLVDAQQRAIADPVADPGAEHRGPEKQVALDIAAVQTEMTELGDPGIARGKVAHAGLVWPIDQLDAVVVGIGKGNEGLDPALFAFGRSTPVDLDTLCGQLALGRLQLRQVAQFERRNVIRRIALDVAEVEGAAVATQVGVGRGSFA
ncbi:hypothetical protein D9M68_741340 [compost metagenome]